MKLRRSHTTKSTLPPVWLALMMMQEVWRWTVRQVCRRCIDRSFARQAGASQWVAKRKSPPPPSAFSAWFHSRPIETRHETHAKPRITAPFLSLNRLCHNWLLHWMTQEHSAYLGAPVSVSRKLQARHSSFNGGRCQKAMLGVCVSRCRRPS